MTPHRPPERTRAGPPDARGSFVAPVALGPAGVAVLAATTLLFVVVAVVFMRDVSLNVEAFTAVQSATREWPDAWWSCVTICGTGVVAFALLSPTLAWRPRWYAAAIVAAAFAGAYSNGMKRLYGLPRPAAVLDAGSLHAIGHALRANTFPSGHTVTAFTLASLLIFASTRPLRTATWTLPLATLIAVSRIAVGAHWPADLAAGAAGGWVSGALAVAIVGQWRIWNTVAGVRAMAFVSIGIGVSLFVVDLGYPQAIALQFAAGIVAIVAGLVAFARPRLDPWPSPGR